MSFTIGATIGPYEIREKLGKGGMATVYKAYHAALDRYVAIKVLHATFQDDDSFLRRFSREAKVVAKLEHPHIVAVYDFAEHDGYPYLVMRYIPGETLKERLRTGLLSRSEILRIATAIAKALDYAHQQGVLHRDIKPSNILLTAGGGVYITDFGLARITQAGESTLSQDMIMGTPQYISPEQAKGTKELDGRTDVYSFGIVLYEMVTGQVPFQSETGYSIIHAQIFDDPPAPSTLNEKINLLLENVLLRALRKAPDERYATAGELVTAFQEATSELGTNMARAAEPTLPDYTPVGHTQLASAPPPLPDLSEAPSSQITPKTTLAAQAKNKKQKRPVYYIVGGVAMGMLLCLCVFLVLINRNNQNNNPSPDQSFVPGPDAKFSLADLNTETTEPQALAELALAHLQNDNPDEARRIVRHVFEPINSPDGYIDAAERLLELDYDALAVIVLEEGIAKLDTNDPQIYEMLLVIYILNQAPSSQIRDLVEAATRQNLTNKTPLVIGLAALSYNQGEAESAQTRLRQAIPNARRFEADIYFLLAITYREQGVLDEAAEALQNAQKAEPAPWLADRINKLLQETP